MKPYVPELLPLKSLRWDAFVPLLGKASYELARYEGILQGIVNPAVFLSPLTTQEAVLSSRIEGTQATLEEVLEYQALPRRDAAKKEDIQEVINYRRALDYAAEYLSNKPISLNLIRGIHYRLLDSVRGRNKARGEFRTTQNYIGTPGLSIEQATYVPPPPERVMEFLSNLEKYIHYQEKDALVQLAIIHAQFEIIHPFLDGNGRVGRILIPLFLMANKLLSSPTFYISAYLEAHRDVYCEKLNGITRRNQWEDWIAFFLNAVTEQARSNAEKAMAILNLYNEMKLEVAQVTRSQYAIKSLDAVFEEPLFNAAGFIQRSRIPKPSAMRILNQLKEGRIVTVLREGKGNRPAVFQFTRLVDIVK